MNPAKRLLVIYDKLVQNPDDKNMSIIWAHALELDSKAPHFEDTLLACLVGIRAEAQLANAQLTKIGIPADMRGPGINNLASIASPKNLNHRWHQVRGTVLPQENRVTLTWASWTLEREEEGDVPTEDRTALVQELKALQDALADIEMSEHLRDFVERQVGLIQRALTLFPVQGAKPLKEALRSAIGDLKVEEKELLAEVEAAPSAAQGAMARVMTLLEKAAKVADQGSKLKKGVDELAKLGGAAFDHATSVANVVKPFVQQLLGP